MKFSLPFKKLFFSVAFNFCLFTLLIIGIQNSSQKIKLNLLIGESIKLPTSFIIGTSFIAGSIIGSFLNINGIGKKQKLDS